ncbi:MAG: hypothetical protein E6I52_09035 [Chloroflexi bacterium]|nr:MAG: hypothetical protein E6I52_09035 [Chloroflexota bacterium]
MTDECVQLHGQALLSGAVCVQDVLGAIGGEQAGGALAYVRVEDGDRACRLDLLGPKELDRVHS